MRHNYQHPLPRINLPRPVHRPLRLADINTHQALPFLIQGKGVERLCRGARGAEREEEVGWAGGRVCGLGRREGGWGKCGGEGEVEAWAQFAHVAACVTAHEDEGWRGGGGAGEGAHVSDCVLGVLLFCQVLVE